MIFAYIRVSTDAQTGESQRFEIDKFCEEHHWRVDRWVEESVSGTVPFEKRSLGKLIKKMRRGDLLLCTEISRLGRNMLMVMAILNACIARGIRIRTIKDRFELGDDLNSKIIAFAFALASEIERNLISQRTREALAAVGQHAMDEIYISWTESVANARARYQIVRENWDRAGHKPDENAVRAYLSLRDELRGNVHAARAAVTHMHGAAQGRRDEAVRQLHTALSRAQDYVERYL